MPYRITQCYLPNQFALDSVLLIIVPFYTYLLSHFDIILIIVLKTAFSAVMISFV